MSFELSFSPEFFFAEGEPYDGGYAPQDEPWSVWMAICSMEDDEWALLAREVFDIEPEYLTPETVMDKIRETDTCADLRSPVEVYIDEAGYHSVLVYDKPDGEDD